MSKSTVWEPGYVESGDVVGLGRPSSGRTLPGTPAARRRLKAVTGSEETRDPN